MRAGRIDTIKVSRLGHDVHIEQVEWESSGNENGGLVVRIALVGCGEHSRSSHAAPLARYAAEHRGEIELVAACDLNADRAAEFCRTFGFARSYADLNRMLDEEKLDGCVSVLPIDHIVNTGIELLERRVPCVIEKPLGTSREEAERLSLATRKTQTTHMVSVNRRFMPYLNQVRSWIQASGPLRYVRAVQVRHARSEEDFIWSTTIHVMDALRHMVGEVETFDVDIQQPGGSSATLVPNFTPVQKRRHGYCRSLAYSGHGRRVV